MRMIELTKVNTSRFNDNEEGEGVTSTPVTVNAANIRCFYPRRENKPGCRITFADGGGFVVSETYDVVKAAVSPT